MAKKAVTLTPAQKKLRRGIKKLEKRIARTKNTQARRAAQVVAMKKKLK